MKKETKKMTHQDIGSKIPDMTLKDQKDEEYIIVGKKVLLSFHPLAWTGICAKQMQSLEAKASEFAELGCEAVGISVDSVPCKEAWSEHLGIQKTRLLADFWPHGGFAKSLNLFREKEGFSERANVIVHNGNIIFRKVYDLGELPDIEEILHFLRKEKE